MRFDDGYTYEPRRRPFAVRRPGSPMAPEPGPFPLARAVVAAGLLGALVAADLAVEGALVLVRLDEARREQWAKDGSTLEQRFWLGVYQCLEAPASLLRKGALYAIGKAGEATDWGEHPAPSTEVAW